MTNTRQQHRDASTCPDCSYALDVDATIDDGYVARCGQCRELGPSGIGRGATHEEAVQDYVDLVLDNRPETHAEDDCPTCASPLTTVSDPITDRYEVGCEQCASSTRAHSVAAAIDGYIAYRLGLVVEHRDTQGNLRGRITDDASDALAALDALCEDLPTYWDAGDWCADGWPTCRDEVRGCDEDDDKLDALAEAWVADARSNGAHLHLVDVARIIQHMRNEIAEEGEENA